MRNVLMVVPFFPPNAGGGVYRPLGFVRYLPRCGWRPTVVTPEAGSFWIQDPSLLADVPEDCVVHRTKTLSGQYLLASLTRPRGGKRPAQVRSSRRFSFMRRAGSFVLVPDTYAGWYPFAVAEGRKLLRDGTFDAIYSTSPPETTHLVGRKLSAVSGLPWAADFRDPWMNLHLFHPPTPLHAKIHAALERSVCSRASVIVTNHWHADLLRGRYPEIKRLEIISNGYDADKFAPLDSVVPPRDRFCILHTGMLTQKRSAVPFLRALRAFIDARPDAAAVLRVTFIGARESANETPVSEFGLDAFVTFQDTVGHADSLQMQRESHILLLIKHLDDAYRGIIPGKLYEYIGARRPILSLAPDGEANNVVSRLRRGETAAPDDPARIAEVLGDMYERYLRGTLDDDYNLAPVPEFTREALAGRLAGLLDSIAK